MPTYDYRCPMCEQKFEIVLNFDDVGEQLCEKDGVPMNKVYYAAPIHFKGSGWAGKG